MFILKATQIPPREIKNRADLRAFDKLTLNPRTGVQVTHLSKRVSASGETSAAAFATPLPPQTIALFCLFGPGCFALKAGTFLPPQTLALSLCLWETRYNPTS